MSSRVPRIGRAARTGRRNVHTAMLLAVACLFLGACQLAPPHVQPAPPRPPQYPHEYAGDVAIGQRATEIGWRDFFEDARLEALVAAALAQNRDLRIAFARVEEARGLYRIQHADRIPTATVDADITHSRVGPGSAGTAIGVPPGTGATTFNRYTIGVSVTRFELDFWGRVRNLSEAARSEYLATAAAQQAFQLSLVRDVATAYLASLEADERMRLAQATLQSRAEGLRIAKVRLDAGITSALDFRQAESLLTQAETELAALRQAKAQSDNLVMVLVGGPIAGPLPDPLPLDRQARGEQVAAELPSALLVARPDVVAAEERLRAAEANIGAARAAFFPTISLTSTIGFASNALEDIISDDTLTWGVGPSLTAPIFNRARIRGNLDVARARGTIAVADYERVVQGAFREVANALAGRRFIADQVAAQERGTRAQRQIAELARLRYLEGVVGYLEVLDAERNLFAAEQALIQLHRAQVENLVDLYVALGGGLIERR